MEKNIWRSINVEIIRFYGFQILVHNMYTSARDPTRVGPKDFLGSEILSKRDFFASIKDIGIFLGLQKSTLVTDFLGIFHQLRSTVT